MSKYEINELYKQENLHLKSLITPIGTKTIYDAVSQCSRCGYCEAVCPTYAVEKRETLSPRGRNQIVRLLIEGKIKENPDLAYESLKTCLLCGACTSTCYGKVPTADIVLEAKRETKNYGRSFIYKIIIRLRKKTEILSLVLKILYTLKKTGMAWLSEKLGLFYFLGLPSLNNAHKKILKMPKKFLHEELKPLSENIKEDIKWIYFASCGTDYIYTDVGKATIKLLNKIFGNGIFMDNTCCGLISYNYGLIEDAKEFAIKNIEIFEKISERHKNLNIIGDCSSCVAFLKTYPQLFTDDESLFKRASNFSANVRDITEYIKPEHLINKIDIEKIKGKKITLHHSCKACHGQGIFKEPEEVLSAIFGKNLVEMKESDMCCGGAGAFSFTNPQLSEKILRRKLENIATTQADFVVVSSTSCLLQIGFGLKEHYPSSSVIHYSELLEKILKED